MKRVLCWCGLALLLVGCKAGVKAVSHQANIDAQTVYSMEIDPLPPERKVQITNRSGRVLEAYLVAPDKAAQVQQALLEGRRLPEGDIREQGKLEAEGRLTFTLPGNTGGVVLISNSHGTAATVQLDIGS
ncbi:MAG TPA: hypothetical protein PKD86_00570 [Gemmatales bacterium]|nr:hypothetical protein [Gemmatales bacterium]HMP57817.1 hypothetical protein [Gemmatales bacterium]